MAKRGVRRVMAAGIISAAISSIVYAQFAVPVSDRVLKGQIILPDRTTVATFEIREGAALAVRNNDGDGDFWYAFVPLIDKSAQKVRIKGFKFTPVPDDDPKVEEIIIGIDAPFGRVVPLRVPDQFLAIKLEGVRQGYFPSIPAVEHPSLRNPELLKMAYSSSGGGICSLTCNSTTVTATTVQMPCGVCRGAR